MCTAENYSCHFLGKKSSCREEKIDQNSDFKARCFVFNQRTSSYCAGVWNEQNGRHSFSFVMVFFLFSISFSDYNDCFKTTYANRCFFFSFIQITDAFDSSATLLNHAYRKQGLTVDAVDDVMEKTAEVAYYLHLVLFSCP